jgi:hypothetical protein
MAWSRENDKCISCDTEEWEHKGNGHCSKCYPLIKKKEIIKQWNLADPTTLKAVSPVDEQILEHLIRHGELEKAKENLLRQIEARLYLYKKFNSPGQVDPIAIEYLYERIASITNNVSDQKLFHGAVTRYREIFNNEQRQIIYKDLALILIKRKLNLNVWRDII